MATDGCPEQGFAEIPRARAQLEAAAEALALIGQREEQIVLRRLVLAVPSESEVDATLQRAEALRDNLERGVLEFDTAISEYSIPQFRGDQSFEPPLPRETLEKELVKRHGASAALEAFFAEVEVGDLSPVVTLEDAGTGIPTVALIYRAERVEAART